MNNGFVKFPVNNPSINRVDQGRTMIYICAFDTLNAKDRWTETANIHVNRVGTFVSDDVMSRPISKNISEVDDILDLEKQYQQYDKLYFPHEENQESVPMQTAICVGWIDAIFEKRDYTLWYADFKDLTKNGKELYFLIKKLHHNKEVRILTFSE
jgi:hypothetical protein